MKREMLHICHFYSSQSVFFPLNGHDALLLIFVKWSLVMMHVSFVACLSMWKVNFKLLTFNMTKTTNAVPPLCNQFPWMLLELFLPCEFFSVSKCSGTRFENPYPVRAQTILTRIWNNPRFSFSKLSFYETFTKVCVFENDLWSFYHIDIQFSIYDMHSSYFFFVFKF